jgi:hypothetical protein
MVWWSFVVKEFWALWDNTVRVAMVYYIQLFCYILLYATLLNCSIYMLFVALCNNSCFKYYFRFFRHSWRDFYSKVTTTLKHSSVISMALRPTVASRPLPVSGVDHYFSKTPMKCWRNFIVKHVPILHIRRVIVGELVFTSYLKWVSRCVFILRRRPNSVCTWYITFETWFHHSFAGSKQKEIVETQRLLGDRSKWCMFAKLRLLGTDTRVTLFQGKVREAL